jgi:cyclopropane fatty-acyl-phospholipid synthase-like methyltransferase
MTTLTYCPEVFTVRTMDEAKAIILTQEAEGTHERWEKETPYLAGEISTRLGLDENSVVLDYGCGIGRLAKVLIEATGCTVIGVDISPSMRSLAHIYVDSPNFVPVSIPMFVHMVQNGLRVDAAYAVWVLQHCLMLDDDLNLIHGALKDGARLVTVNDERRLVPTREHAWVDDGLVMREVLREKFVVQSCETLLAEAVASNVAEGSFIGTYQKVLQ